jgi:hypothetical protein
METKATNHRGFVGCGLKGAVARLKPFQIGPENLTT